MLRPVDDVAASLERARASRVPRLEVLPRGRRRGARSARSVGLVAGSFDPMTVGHAALAEAVAGSTGLALLVYSPRTLPKEGGPGGPAVPPLLEPEDRVRSLLAWSDGRPDVAVAVCSHGLYADQAEAARRAFPRAEVVLGLGSDKVIQLFDPSWYEDPDAALERLFALARVAYAVRPGDERPLAATLARHPERGDRLTRIDLPPETAQVSSRSVRAAVARGEDVSAMVPPEVLPFVLRAAGRRASAGP